jgi:hypothetical protein
MRNTPALIALVVFPGIVAAADAPPDAGAKWAVHEWGTFTSLQDESGNAVGGINTDDEPAPKFVHRRVDLLLLTPTQGLGQMIDTYRLDGYVPKETASETHASRPGS